MSPRIWVRVNQFHVFIITWGARYQESWWSENHPALYCQILSDASDHGALTRHATTIHGGLTCQTSTVQYRPPSTDSNSNREQKLFVVLSLINTATCSIFSRYFHHEHESVISSIETFVRHEVTNNTLVVCVMCKSPTRPDQWLGQMCWASWSAALRDQAGKLQYNFMNTCTRISIQLSPDTFSYSHQEVTWFIFYPNSSV